MADGFYLDTIFLCGEEEADKVGIGSRGRSCRGRGRVERLLDDEELKVSNEERVVVGVGATPEVLSWPEEKEECGPGQVADGLLPLCYSLTGGVEVLEDGDGDGEDLCQRGVLFYIDCELLSQAKVEITQRVVPGVAGPHGGKYLPDGTKVLFHGPLLDGDPAG